MQPRYRRVHLHRHVDVNLRGRLALAAHERLQGVRGLLVWVHHGEGQSSVNAGC